jgi:ribosomal protein S12 methylthiotransferase
MSKIAVTSLGCAKNLVDTEIMLGQLTEAGWEVTSNFQEAELILVNTCGFIGPAKQESIDEIIRMAEYKKPNQGSCRKLVVAGCLVQRYAAELIKELPEVDVWLGLGEIGKIVSLINERKPQEGPDLSAVPFLNQASLTRWQATLSHTTFIKVAEGCSHNCAYCAIPLIKGKFRSVNPEAIISEVKRMVEHGVKEFNLIAQDLTVYGKDLEPGTNLESLLERLIKEAKPPWIRLLYSYPSGINPGLLKLIANEPSICNYLDLPLQHINARILKLMNRRENPEQLRKKLALIRELVPDITLRTSFIVGFPSESEAEFWELADFVGEGIFQHAGVFVYSREEGTKAFDMRPQLSEKVKEERREILLERQGKVSAQYLAGQIGKEVLVLIDKILPDGRAIGRSTAFAPEVDGVIYIEKTKRQAGEFVTVRITGSDVYNLTAKAIENY